MLPARALSRFLANFAANRRLPVVLALFFGLFIGAPNLFGQGSKRMSLYDAVEEKDRDQPEKRAEWMMRGRTAPKGQSAAALRLRAYQQKMAMRAQRAAAMNAAGAKPQTATPWVPLGPAPLTSDQDYYGVVTGRSTAIAVDPSDATGNTVYIAGASGGVWKSTNAAAATASNVTWTPVTDQQASLTAGAISVKSDGSVVLVGTGEPDNAIDSYYGVGILRSTDKGSTWTLVSSSDSGAHPFAGIGFTKFAWLPSSNTVVVAGADTFKGDQEDLLNPSDSGWGMYLSTDGGQTWAYQAPTDGSKPNVSATDVTYNAAAGKFFAVLQYHGLYSSTNGTSWTRIANQPDPTDLTLANCPTTVNFSNNLCPLYRGQITTVPGRNEMYFWYVDGNDNDYGIWRSTNGGNSWTAIDETGITSCGDSSGCGTTQAFYNLEISAVPHPSDSGTDIYAGAVNLFKCSLASGATTCSTVDSNSPNSWLNLTHVYGCSNLASVHPDEHGLDFMIVSGKDIMYFGNDGGIYRTLDGHNGLVIGSCSTSGTNKFDDLNANMGSMTQFVSFSLHPTDQDTLLGGTQDNGSPATSTATTSSHFITVLGGDGGYNAIDPSSTNNWFVSNPNSEIGLCTLGINCTDNDTNYVASPDVLGNIDYGAFYTPFILDPQDAGEMLIGTCRIWRGTAVASGTFTQLSPNFDTDDTTACNGGEINQVHGLAAGGPKDTNGFSNVIYAVTFGLGPLFGYGTGGEVWVTTNASTTQLSQLTGFNITQNPSNYALSSVAIDNSDATGATAYVGVMGFGTSHVWKTTNFGTAWTDWSGSGGSALPNAPVNDVLVDFAAGQIYAATDVGVFVSSTSSASWAEVGTPAAPGATGYLPNVPTSALRIFNSGGVKKLRVSTYGRGIWEYALPEVASYSLSASPTSLSIADGSQNTSTITVTSSNGFNSAVTLSATGQPTGVNVTFGTNPVTPPANSTGTSIMTVAVGASVATGTYTITVTGTSGSTTESTTVGLTVTAGPSFTLSAAPSSVTITPTLTGGTSTITVTDLGGFTGSVTLSATGLPTGVTAQFNPTSTTTTSTLTLTAGANATAGTATVTIVGTSGSLSANTTIALTVTNPPSFTLSDNPSTLTIDQGESTTSTITVTPQNGFTGSVNLAASVPTGVTATFSPNPATSTSTLTLTVSNTATSGTATVTISGVGGGVTKTTTLSLTVVQSFGIVVIQPQMEGFPGQSNSAQLVVSTTDGQPFANSVSFSCPASLPTGVTCTAPSPITAGSSGSQTLTVNLGTSGPWSGAAGSIAHRATKLRSQNQRLWLPVGLPLAGLILVGFAGKRIPRVYQILGLCLAVGLAGFLIACGGSSSSPPVVTVSPSSASMYPNLVVNGQSGTAQTQAFTASVSNTSNQSVTWAVNGTTGGNSTVGTIDTNGNYTAPATDPGTSISVTATSSATSTPGTASVTLKTPTPGTTPGNPDQVIITAQGSVTQGATIIFEVY